MPEQFLNHVKQHNVVKRTGLVETYYTACKKCKQVQKDWEKAMTDIGKYKESIVKVEPVVDQAILKELKKAQDACSVQ